MNRIAASQFRNDFGIVMDSVQHSSVIITKRGRDFATLFSNKTIQDNAKELLGEYPLELVETGQMDIFEALKFQKKIEEGNKKANEDYKNGDYFIADDDYFDNFKERAKALAKKSK